MKRNLLENVGVMPYTPGQTVDRLGALSAVLAVQFAADTTAKVTLTHSDEPDSGFEPVLDERLFLGETRIALAPDGKPAEVSAEITAKAGQVANLDIDLICCKRCVKIHVAPAGTAHCLVLGDFNP
jgi:hypothetical protein